MAALGRIKRDRTKVLKAALRTAGRAGSDRTVNVRVSVGRDVHYRDNTFSTRAEARYSAKACIAALAKWPRDRKRIDPTCGFGAGRTPQSAIAGALKRLSFKVAKRGRGGKR